MIEFKFGERVARATQSRRFHCCRCNLILEVRNKKRHRVALPTRPPISSKFVAPASGRVNSSITSLRSDAAVRGRRERIRIKALLAETQSLLAASLPSHVGITVSETSEKTIVSAEPAQLQQVIMNVCNNAAQAMEKSGVIESQIGFEK
jgi:hypothetical protein